MATPAAHNELEKLDMLLSKLDAVRYALPEVLDFFMEPKAGLSAAANAQDTIQDYRYRVTRAERSLQDLQRNSVALSGSLSDLVAQADRLKLDEAKLQRLRKNPYSGRIHAASNKTSSELHKILYTSLGNDVAIKSVEALNAKLDEVVDKYASLRIMQKCELWNKRSIIVQLEEVASFHIFVTWTNDSQPKFQRLNVVGCQEDKESYQVSDLTVWQNIGIHVSQAILRHGSKSTLDLPCIMAVIDAYKSIQEVPCHRCHRLLHNAAMQLPTARVYQSTDAKASHGEWIAYHPECYASP